MDAISFVLGEKTSSLRVRKLSDLIHGSPVGRPVSNRARVTATYNDENGQKIVFSRIIKGSSAEHQVDGVVVSHADYNKKLESINIFIKSKNFLVFQGQVEHVAMKNPKERTQLFEEISGSNQFKENYEKTKSEMTEAEQETQFSYHRKKGIAAEKKEAKQEKDEAEKYEKLQKDFQNSKTNIMLFKLFYNEREIEEIRNEQFSKDEDFRRNSEKKLRLEGEVKTKKQEQGKVMREMTFIDADVHKKEKELNKKRPRYIKAKENTSYMTKKVENSKKSLKTAELRHDNHMQVIRDLKKQIHEVDAKRKEFDGEMEQESKQSGRDFELEEGQVQEYHRLKDVAAKRSTKIMHEIELHEREQQDDTERLDRERRKKGELEAEKKQKTKEEVEAGRRIEKLEEYISTSRKTLAEHKKLKNTLEQDVEKTVERIRKINEELEDVMKRQGDAKVDRTESSRQKGRQELLENLRRLFPGVHGRVLNLCEPIHGKYKIAITKVLGKYMYAIVVDSEKTARDCIQYMKEQCAEPETFLPLDYIDAKPINEQLREISEPVGVKLVIDVIKYEVPVVKRALQFTCGNSLVCETAEDARKVAFGQYQKRKTGYGNEENIPRRNQAVALDGTLFQKSGVISGGASDLKKKAKRWDDKVLIDLQSKKERLTEDLKQEMKGRRKEADLQNVTSQIEGLKNRIRYSMNDLENSDNGGIKGHRENIKQKLENIERELQNFEPKFMEIERVLEGREVKINEHKKTMNEVEDDVFKDFCVQIGVANIRLYEERELRKQQETLKKRLEFDNQKSRLSNQLEYEQSLDTKQNVTKWREMIKNDEQAIEKNKREEKSEMRTIRETENELDKLKEKKMDKKKIQDEKVAQIEVIRRELTECNKKMSQYQKLLSAQELRIEQKKEARHSILQQCKIEDVFLPLNEGSLTIEESQETENLSQLQSQMQGTQLTQAIYDREALLKVDYSSLKDLRSLDWDEVKVEVERLQSVQNDLQSTIQRIAAPNMKAFNHLNEVKSRYHESKDQFDNVRKRAKKSKQEFDYYRKTRVQTFNQCFEFVASQIDDIYKTLSRNNSAQAFLGSENAEEPYLEGTTYNCVAPGKRFRPMDNLSGGEKTVAALALLFAIHKYQPSPFFVLDEIDAALDNTNIGKVADYIKQMSTKVQCIVISLKEEFYNKVDALVGIYPVQGDGCIASNVVSLDLSCYPEAPQEQIP